jgi:alkanesulfonate monooxygenase
VAVQPVYMHPYTAAKMVASLADLHGRRLYLNMVAGASRMTSLPSTITRRTTNATTAWWYWRVINGVLTSENGFRFSGGYYTVSNLKMPPSVPDELFPGIVISGSSGAGLAAATAIGATAVKYLQPPGEEEEEAADVPRGCRLGIIARENAEDAWAVAYERFPEDRNGQITPHSR